jgi:hypothetical protein
MTTFGGPHEVCFSAQQMRCVAGTRGVLIMGVMTPDIMHVRLLPEDRRSLDDLLSKFSESGLEITPTELLRLALRRLPANPGELFRPPEGAPR